MLALERPMQAESILVLTRHFECVIKEEVFQEFTESFEIIKI